MKKFTKAIALLLVFATVFALAACGGGNDDEGKVDQVKVGVLSGATGMGAVKIAKDNVSTEETKAPYDVKFYGTNEVSNVFTDVIKGNLHIAALPINAAATLFKQSAGKVEVIAINALGVLSLIGKNNLPSVSELAGATVYAPGSGTPRFILKHILQENGLTVVESETDELGANGVRVLYETDGAAVKAKYDTETATAANVYALLPEPAATAALVSNNTNKLVFDINAEWDKVCDTKLVQGVLVANKDFAKNNKALLEKFLKDYKASVDYVNASENADAAADLMVEYNLVPAKPIAKKAIPKAIIVCEIGSSMKTDVSAMIDVLFAIAPASVGGEKPADAFYGIYAFAN